MKRPKTKKTRDSSSRGVFIIVFNCLGAYTCWGCENIWTSFAALFMVNPRFWSFFFSRCQQKKVSDEFARKTGAKCRSLLPINHFLSATISHCDVSSSDSSRLSRKSTEIWLSRSPREAFSSKTHETFRLDCFLLSRRPSRSINPFLLQKSGVDFCPSITDFSLFFSQTALSYICSTNLTNFLELFLHLPGIDVNKADNEGNTPLHFASQAGRIMGKIVLLRSCEWNSPLHPQSSSNLRPALFRSCIQRKPCNEILIDIHSNSSEHLIIDMKITSAATLSDVGIGKSRAVGCVMSGGMELTATFARFMRASIRFSSLSAA